MSTALYVHKDPTISPRPVRGRRLAGEFRRVFEKCGFTYAISESRVGIAPEVAPNVATFEELEQVNPNRTIIRPLFAARRQSQRSVF